MRRLIRQVACLANYTSKHAIIMNNFTVRRKKPSFKNMNQGGQVVQVVAPYAERPGVLDKNGPFVIIYVLRYSVSLRRMIILVYKLR